jgi:ribosomal protein S18 acetylase RimI-like enzyme
VDADHLKIRAFKLADEAAVVGLWLKCDMLRPANNPHEDIRRKLKVNPELFLVGELDKKIVATAMAGYEGHRGALNYMAVDPDCRKLDIGRRMMAEVEKRLVAAGCPKLNLMVRNGNTGAMEFYRKVGFKPDEAVEFGKRLIDDPPY